MTDLLGGVSKAAYTKSLNSYTSQLISLQNQSMNETSGQTFQNLVINVDTSNSVVPDQFAKQIIDSVTGAASTAAAKNNSTNKVTAGSGSKGGGPKISTNAGNSGVSSTSSSSTSSPTITLPKVFSPSASSTGSDKYTGVPIQYKGNSNLTQFPTNRGPNPTNPGYVSAGKKNSNLTKFPTINPNGGKKWKLMLVYPFL